jgi:ABC-type antimicrobial peptide transport system permease subunit
VSPQIFQTLASQRIASGGLPVNYIVHPDAFSRVGSIERVIVQADPEAVIARNVAWRDLIGESVRGQTFASISVVLFTVAAIVIVAVGIANTVMFIIARRTREIAIHMAVGASSRQVCWFVTRDMVKSGIAGILIGGFASWWTGKAVAHFIYHGDRYQNLTGLVLTSAAMILVIVITALLPALRALRIEPSRALTLE